MLDVWRRMANAKHWYHGIECQLELQMECPFLVKFLNSLRLYKYEKIFSVTLTWNQDHAPNHCQIGKSMSSNLVHSFLVAVKSKAQNSHENWWPAKNPEFFKEETLISSCGKVVCPKQPWKLVAVKSYAQNSHENWWSAKNPEFFKRKTQRWSHTHHQISPYLWSLIHPSYHLNHNLSSNINVRKTKQNWRKREKNQIKVEVRKQAKSS